MNPVLIFVSTILIASVSVAFDVHTFQYIERDEGTTHLYKATCFSEKGEKPTCSMRSISVRSDKSSAKCAIDTSQLFSDEIATKTGETFVVTVSRGACRFVNTYVLTSKMMTQVKTAPDKLPENLKGLCGTPNGKTYTAVSTEALVAPMGNCPDVKVMFD